MINNLVTFNCKGIGDKRKRVEIFKWLKREHPGVCFLQETHSSKKNETRWQTDLGRQYRIYYSHGTSGAKGVATIIPQKLVRNVISETRDGNGRFMILRLKTEHGIVCLMNVYGPTQDFPKEQIEFLTQCETYLELYQDDLIIAGGDWNIQLNPRVDKFEGDNTPHTKASKYFSNFL